jgi:outer membrane protein assembly factor BamD (BamD/ComL family)
MAIIKCPECGQSVSELADKCPGCGCPINGNIDHCPECGEIVLKTYTECPKCHCPIQKIEKEKEESSTLLKSANEAFNAGKANQASVYIEQALAHSPQDPAMLELKRRIDERLKSLDEKYEEAKNLFERDHQPYPALALINKLIATEPAPKYTELRDDIVSSIIKMQLEKARTLINEGKPELALTTLAKIKPYDQINPEIKNLTEEATEKADKKRRRHRNTITAIIVAAVLVVFGIGGYIFYGIQSENAAWDQLQSSTNLNDFEQFLSEYPHGRHHDDAEQLYKKLSTELTAWAAVSSSVDKYAVQKFLQQYPNGVCATQAKNRLDSLSWVDACNINKPEAYAQYITDFPNGKYIAQAQQKTTQLKDQELTPSEENQASAVLSQFFDGIATQNEDQVTGSVAATMDKFLNKRNATKAHVLMFMKQMHAPDITSMTFNVNKDLKMQKTQKDDGENSYKATCTVDEKIERTDADKETFVSYGVIFSLDNFMKISSMELRKISSSK